MLGKDLSEALGGISDEKLQDAMTVYKRKKQVRSLWFRAAALAATLAIVLTAALWPRETEEGGIITAPGVLKVYAYDMTTGTEIKNVVSDELPDGVASKPSIWNPYMSAVFGLPFTFEIADDYYSDMAVTFDVSVNCGEFWHYNKEIQNYEKLGETFSVENGERIYWRGARVSEAKETIENEGGIYADVIVRADGQIVGYAVVEIGYAEEPMIMFPVRCETICFPMIDGELQNISKGYVTEQISEYKASVSLYSGEEKLAEYHEYISSVFGGDSSEN